MILDTIVAHKRQELVTCKAQRPLSALRRQAEDAASIVDFATALAAPGVQLIAEVKRASPSKGIFRADLDPVALAQTYVENGATAISVLTDKRFFKGRLADLTTIKTMLSARNPVPAPGIAESSASSPVAQIPVLRKDFLIDPYQVYEARAAGADAVLLIVAILDDPLLTDLLAITHELGMTGLVEVHDETELARALAVNPRAIGVNNRDLRNFSVDLATTERLRPAIPDGTILIAESGIHSVADVRRLAEAGVDAILVGEALVTAEDIAAKVWELAGRG